MTKQGTILIVDDNKGVLAAIDMLLSGTFKKVITISNPNRIPAMLETENIDVVLLDMNFSSGITTPGKGNRTKKTTDFGRRVDLGRFSGHAATTSADRESSFYGCQYSDHRRKRYRQGNDCQGTAQTFQTE